MSSRLKRIGRALRAPSRDIDVITTTQGGEDVAKAAIRGGALLGYESHTSRPPEDLPVEFVDWPYSKEVDRQSLIDHLLTVEREQPRYAVAPDVTSALEFPKFIRVADELNKHASTVIVVPKAVRPKHIPDRFRVGVPFRNGFETLPWPVWEFQGNGPFHILGGNPNKQRELARMLGTANVASLDTAHPTMKANWGEVWTPDGYTQQDHGYYGTIEHSMTNLLKKWNGEDAVDESRLRSRRLKLSLPEPNFGNSSDDGGVDDDPLSFDIEDHTPEPDLLAPGEEVPHPGRAYMEQTPDPAWEPGMTANELSAKT